MEITGKIYSILPVQTGQGKNGEWKKQSIVLEVENGKYPKKVAITVWGDVIDKNTFTEGGEIDVKIDIESREYNGKWYTDVKGYSVTRNTSVNEREPTAQEKLASLRGEEPQKQEFKEPDISPNNDDDDDLPF